jgi:type VI protein secretion system component VasK
VVVKMAGKISGFLREYVFGLSIIVMIVGSVLLLMGIMWYWFRDLQLGFYTDTIQNLKDWNAYLLVIGLIIFGIGVWYLYSYLKNRKFVLEELKTNKRSELLKKHGELKDTVRLLPSKYKKMLKEKEDELRIK